MQGIYNREESIHGDSDYVGHTGRTCEKYEGQTGDAETKTLSQIGLHVEHHVIGKH